MVQGSVAPDSVRRRSHSNMIKLDVVVVCISSENTFIAVKRFYVLFASRFLRF